MLHARLFGPLRLAIDEQPVPDLPGLRPRALLAYLLLHPGPHARAHLAAAFWPDVLDTSARASLRSALHTIRVALDAVGGGAYLAGDRAQIGIARALPRLIDSERFDGLVVAGDAASLEEAFGLAERPLLADLADDWVLEARDDYRERAVRAALALADAAEEAGDLPRAVDWTRRGLAGDRLSEETHRALMRRLAAAGERGQALAAYARCRAVLAAEFGTAPSHETRTLATQLRATGDHDALSAPPAPRAPAAHAIDLFVGRADEAVATEQAWRRAAAGEGGVLLVTGPAGIGKSRLAARLAEIAEAEGAFRATATPLDLEGGPALAVWSQVVRELVREAPDAPPASAAWPADLARLCSAVETVWVRAATAVAPSPDLERARLFEAVVESLDWFAASRPVLLVFEDVHGLDAASLALLAYVGRRLARLPVLLAATRRPAATNSALELAVDSLQRSGAPLTTIDLGPLDDEALAAIVAGAAPGLAPELAATAVRVADGTPLLARAAARALAAGESPSHGLRTWLRAPLARLGESSRLLVDVAAAAGRPLWPGEAADLVGAEQLPAALDEATGADLLETGADRRIGFGHALLREACNAELSEGRRAWIHGRLADTLLARRRRSAAEVGRHLLLAGDPERALPFLASAAAEARALGAVDEAALLLREAAGLAAEDPGVAAELWLELATVESWRGNRPGYDEAFDRAVALIGADGDHFTLAAAYVNRARCLWTTLCYPLDASAASRRALAELDATTAEAPELYALALTGTAWSESVDGDVDEALRLADAVDALPDGVAQQSSVAGDLAFVRGVSYLRQGQDARSEREIERAVALSLEAGRPELAQLSLSVAGSMAAGRGDFARSLECAERGLELGDHGQHLRGQSLAARAHALSRLGRHDEAVRAAGEAAALERGSWNPNRTALAAYDRGCILLAAGAPAPAREQLAAALEAPEAALPRATARLDLAEATLRCGDTAAARLELERVPFERVGAADFPETLVPRLERLQGLIAAAEGDAEGGERLLASAEATWRARQGGAPDGSLFGATVMDIGRVPIAGLVEPAVELGRVLAERALLLARCGRTAEAAAAAEEAAALADELAFDGYRATLALVPLEMEV